MLSQSVKQSLSCTVSHAPSVSHAVSQMHSQSVAQSVSHTVSQLHSQSISQLQSQPLSLAVSQLVSQLVGFDWPQMLPLPTHTLMGKRSCYIDYNFSWRHFLSVCRSVNCLPVHYDCPGMCECLGRGGSICPCTNVCLLHRLWNKMSQRACLMLPCVNL